MILTVATNPALEVTYRAADAPGSATHDAGGNVEAPGGPALRVAARLVASGDDVTVIGFVGGPSGQRIRELATAQGLAPAHWFEVEHESRRSDMVIGREISTDYDEPGRAVGLGGWQNLIGTLVTELRPGDLLTCHDPVPAGTQGGSIARLVQAAHMSGGRALVEASGRWLAEAARVGADLLVCDRQGLADAVGSAALATGNPALRESSGDIPVTAAFKLTRQGAQAVLVIDGERLNLFLKEVPDRYWVARLPQTPPGGGVDLSAAVAEYCRVLASGRSPAAGGVDVLRTVAALAAGGGDPAAVEVSAERWDPPAVERFLPLRPA